MHANDSYSVFQPCASAMVLLVSGLIRKPYNATAVIYLNVLHNCDANPSHTKHWRRPRCLLVGQQPFGPNSTLLRVARSRDSLTALHQVNSVHSVMLSVHLFGGLPLSRTPSTEPSNTIFTSRSSGMRQICPKDSSFLRRVISTIVSVLSNLCETLSAASFDVFSCQHLLACFCSTSFHRRVGLGLSYF